MPVNNTHPDYDRTYPKWSLVRSIIDNCAKHYIRTVDPDDVKRSDQYKDDAILTNFTRLTKIGLTGLVFRKPSLYILPENLKYMLDNCTGYGFGLEQFCQQIVGEILTTGRYFILADHSSAPTANKDMARLKPYAAESIINWRYEEFGSEYLPALITLKEYIDVIEDDIFTPVCMEQYRVLQLLPERVYIQQIYNHKYELVSSNMPIDYNGQPFDHIPGVLVGSENNDETMDAIPLYDLAVVNLGHYKNDADLEEASFVSGQAVPVINIGETNLQEFNTANPGGIKIGSRRGVTIGMGGDFKFSQVQPNILPRELMKDKETQAASIGARLIAPSGGRETAEAARIRYGSQNSALYTITRNIAIALEKILLDIGLFMMETPETSEININNQFYEDSVDPNVLAQLILGLDRNAVTLEEYRDYLKSTGVLPETAEDISPADVLNPLETTDATNNIVPA